MKNVVFIGAGSHADAVYAVMNKSNYQLIGYFDDKNITMHDGFPVLGKIADAKEYILKHNVPGVFVTIGDNDKRKEVFDDLCPELYGRFINIISPVATILNSESISGRGIFIGTNSFLGAKTVVEDNSIINTGSIVEHHTIVGKHVNIAPHTTINGICHIHDLVYVGSSSVIIQVKEICAGSVIGAGAVVVKDILEKGTYVGVPARKLGI